jgi:hypothetical protein
VRVLAVNKSDIVDDAEITTDDINETAHSLGENTPIITVSAKTGDGRETHKLAQSSAAQPNLVALVVPEPAPLPPANNPSEKSELQGKENVKDVSNAPPQGNPKAEPQKNPNAGGASVPLPPPENKRTCC